LRHKASELNLNMRSDGFVKVEDLLKLNMKTFANVPLRSHTDDDVKEVGSVNTFLYIHLHLCSC
jgi:2'-phosphotransferase